ncbi:hypothetical protein JZ751_002392 [Albula glossodonta]|uniref:Uncharacterized protein n=1 Tax=Albula glossodonta TaxID=121402 RepID=A0A8T2N923_9TELE|nr:hypothetical protein JZ751_002392 [Albula glossodonta]
MATSPTCHASQQPRLLAVGLPRSPTGRGRRSCRAEKKLLSSTSDSGELAPPSGQRKEQLVPPGSISSVSS